MDDNINTITVCKGEYNTQEEFENAIKRAICVLLENNYIMTVRYDAGEKDIGVVCIDFNYQNESYGCPYPRWLAPEEFDVLYETLMVDSEESSE